MTTRVPYDQWVASMTKEQLAEHYKAKLAKKGKKAVKAKKPATRSYVKKRAARGGAKGGSRGGNNIIYPNVVGRGPYYLGGGFGYDSEKGFTASGRGYITDSTVEGKGPYNVRSNTLMSAIDLGQDPPKVSNTNRGEAFVINHREYLGDLYSDAFLPGTQGTAFHLQSYNLNPGNSKMFPFLSTIAANFQEYEIRGMLIWLKTLASDYSATMTLGSVFASADYNIYGDTPTTKVQVENMEYASSAKPSKGIIMPIECEAQNNGTIHKKVAIDDEYHGGDKNNFDWAHVFIGSQGVPVEHTPLAEIHITYEVAFFKPIIGGNDPNALNARDAAAWRLVNNTGVKPLGDTLSPFPGNSSNIHFDPVLQHVRFPQMVRGQAPRHYLVNLEISVATEGSFGTGAIGLNHLTPQNVFTTGGTSSATAQALAGWSISSNHATALYYFQTVCGPDEDVINPYMSFSNNWVMPTTSQVARGTLWVSALPAAFNHEELLSSVPSLDKPAFTPDYISKLVQDEVARRMAELEAEDDSDDGFVLDESEAKRKAINNFLKAQKQLDDVKNPGKFTKLC